MMHKFLQNKLWRDKAPDLMRAIGSIVHVKKLDDSEYEQQLKIKLVEEVEEVRLSQAPEQLVEELADVLEVLDAMCALHKISLDEIRIRQAKKRDHKGGFFQRAYVTVAEHVAGSFGEKYCRADPEKYPEIL